jgi:dienelactone hydrolase
MKSLCIITFIIFQLSAISQSVSPTTLGFKHLRILYKTDSVDVLIKSKKGEERLKKPLFFFCQGSQPKPLIITSNKGTYGVFPFDADSLTKYYHLVIVGKPGVLIIADEKDLAPNFTIADSAGRYPKFYTDRNLLSYYVPRNIAVIKYLQTQTWVSSKSLVVAGHSEGSTVAAKMALDFPKVTHLIYAGGNPMGRILSIIQETRSYESDTDSTRYAEEELKYWSSVVDNKNSLDASHGDTDKATYEFSYPPIKYLEKLKIPVLVCYGTKDWSAPFNDLLRVETIRDGKKNFTFNAYVGTEHNFFPVKPDGKADQSIYNWNKVANDWLVWLKSSSAQ